MKFYSWQLFYLNSFRVSNKQFILGLVKYVEKKIEYRHKWVGRVVVEEVTRDGEVAGLNSAGHVARKECRDLQLGTERVFSELK